jgi:transcriptional regulator with XRE-family HTH domain
MSIPYPDVMIARLQKRAGKSQQQIADEAGCSQNFISDLKRRKRRQCEWPVGFRLYRMYVREVLGSERQIVPVPRRSPAKPRQEELQ